MTTAGAPDDVRLVAARLGFDVTAWGEHEGVLDGNGEAFVGTHREIDVFLRAWASSREVATRGLDADLVVQTIIPFASGGIRIYSGQEMTITNRPHSAPFLGRRLAISDRVADLFDVLDVKVGNHSILSGASPIPGFAFSAGISESPDLIARSAKIELSRLTLSHFGRALPFRVCRIAEDLTIRVMARDVGDDGVELDAVVIGEQAPGGEIHRGGIYR